MSIENNVERIATALERIASVLEYPPADPVEPPAEAPKKRGRKPKEEVVVTATPAESAPVEAQDDFLSDSAPVETATIKLADVRKALVDLQKAKGRDIAVSTMKTVGGVEALPALPESKYQAVHAAALKAMQ